jgi:hypothetical protein
MAPMDRSLAISKLVALSAGAALARRQFETTATVKKGADKEQAESGLSAHEG